MITEQSVFQKGAEAVAGKKGKVLLIASGKGGVGKTWFSITLAQNLAESNKKVLLFDGDLGLANVDIQLGLMPEKDLGTVIQGKSTLENAVIPYKEGGFDILAGRSGCGSLASLSFERLTFLQESLRALARKYDYIIVDLGAGIGGTVKALTKIADECIVIVTDEPTSLTDAYAFVKVTHSDHHELPLHLVINQAESSEAGRRVYETLKKVCDSFLHYIPNCLGVIRRDSHVKDSIRNQVPLLTRHKESDAAKDVKAIGKSLMERMG